MEPRIWVNPRQPQTLYLAQILMYFQGGISLLIWLLVGVSVPDLFGSRALALVYMLLVVVGKLIAAYGIANEKRFGYRLGVAAAAAPLVVRFLFAFDDGLGSLFYDPISLMFDIALIALLLHEQSREYQRVWFK